MRDISFHICLKSWRKIRLRIVKIIKKIMLKKTVKMMSKKVRKLKKYWKILLKMAMIIQWLI